MASTHWPGTGINRRRHGPSSQAGHSLSSPSGIFHSMIFIDRSSWRRQPINCQHGLTATEDLIVLQATPSLVLLSASGLLTAAPYHLDDQDFVFDQDRSLVATPLITTWTPAQRAARLCWLGRSSRVCLAGRCGSQIDRCFGAADRTPKSGKWPHLRRIRTQNRLGVGSFLCDVKDRF